MKLYELSTQYKQIVDIAQNEEFTVEQMDALVDTLESINDAIEIKAENIAKIILSLESEAAQIDVEIKRLQDRKVKSIKQADYLRNYLQDAMIQTGKTKFKTALFNFGLRQSASVNIIDETAIPLDYIVIKTESKPNKKLIMEQLKNNINIAGCEISYNQNIQIK